MKKLVTLLSFLALTVNANAFLKKLGEDLGIKVKIGKSVSEKSREVNREFRKFMKNPDSAIPLALIDNAECILFIPNIVKVGFGVGAQTGTGIGTCRINDDEWSSPLFYRISAASLGLNAGAQLMDLVLVFTDRRTGYNTLTKENAALGVDSTITLGPIGREAQLAINFNENGTGPVFAYAKSEGLMIDLLSLKGSTITPVKRLNRKAYGSVNSYGLPSNPHVDLKANTPEGLINFIHNYLVD